MTEKIRDYGAILPCGGKGTRLEAINEVGVPKSLFKVGGKELMLYSLDSLDPKIVDEIIFAIDYKAEQIIEWVEAQRLTQTIDFSTQIKPGILYAVESASAKVTHDQMTVCNTDEIRTGINLIDVIRFHEKQKTLGTMVVTYCDNLSRHRMVKVDERTNIIKQTALKPEEYKAKPNQIGLVNTGFLIIEKRAVELFDEIHNQNWGGIIDPLCDAGQLSAYIGNNTSYFNVGTPEEYLEAEKFLKQNS